MANIQYYERVLKTKKPSVIRRTKILLAAAYALLLAIWLIIVLISGLSASLLVLIPVLVLTVAFLTWKYSSVEYEYSFCAGILVFSKIYGSSGRKAVFEADLRTLVSVSRVSDDSTLRTDSTVTPVYALPSIGAESPYLLVFEKSEKQKAIIIDCDEMTLKILRFFKPSIYISK